MLKKKKGWGIDYEISLGILPPATPPTGTVSLIYKKEGNDSLIAENDFSKQKEKKKVQFFFFFPHI